MKYKKNRFLFMVVGFFIACGLLVIISCDPGSSIKYQIVNKTNDTLALTYRFPGDSVQLFAKIRPHSHKTLRVENELGYADNINDRKDSIYFYSFKLMEKGEVVNGNFKDKKRWSFKKENEHRASYILTINSSHTN